ncbi:hypothetical protein ABLN97_13555 [Mycobacterium tuberculosis]
MINTANTAAAATAGVGRRPETVSTAIAALFKQPRPALSSDQRRSRLSQQRFVLALSQSWQHLRGRRSGQRNTAANVLDAINAPGFSVADRAPGDRRRRERDRQDRSKPAVTSRWLWGNGAAAGPGHPEQASGAGGAARVDRQRWGRRSTGGQGLPFEAGATARPAAPVDGCSATAGPAGTAGSRWGGTNLLLGEAGGNGGNAG